MPPLDETSVLAAKAVLRRAQKYLPQDGQSVTGTYAMVAHILIDEAIALMGE
jgi:hypothetical protein